MNRPAKLLFSGMAAVLAGLGVAAIVTEVHTGSTRRHGIVTLFGDNAVWLGQSLLLLALLPLAVWLPARWVGAAVTVWWLTLMAWLFVLLFRR